MGMLHNAIATDYYWTAVVTKGSEKTPRDDGVCVISPEQRGKLIAARLRDGRRERDGVLLGGSQMSRMPRRPGESTADRNQRILARYLELAELSGGKVRGLPVKLSKEFQLSPQYIRRDVIKPFLLRKAVVRR